MATVLQTQPRRSEREQVFDEFRRWGYLEANLDPLGHLQPQARPELEIAGKDAEEARRYYCGTLGAEFMHIPDADRREWIQQRIESRPAAPDRAHILERLIRAELFEQVLQSRYLGTKRFSLEGITSLIPLLDEIMAVAGEHSSEQVVMG